MENIFLNINVFLFVLLRVTGFMLFNPILSRKNVPAMVRSALIFLLSALFLSIHTFEPIEIRGYFDFALIGAKELFVGFVVGHIVEIFLSIVIVSGQIIDDQFGLTMAKVYDPTSKSQISITASLLNTMFVIFFFQSGAYLELIKILWSSYEIVPIGFTGISPDISMYIVGLFSNMFMLAIKMSMPIIAAHIITEMGVGILMKAVPQIEIFVTNMQIKIAVGVIIFFVVLSPMSRIIDNSLDLMINCIKTALKTL